MNSAIAQLKTNVKIHIRKIAIANHANTVLAKLVILFANSCNGVSKTDIAISNCQATIMIRMLIGIIFSCVHSPQ